MAKSRLLLTQQPLVINKELAKIIGLNEAIVLQQIEYWININETAKKESAYNDNFYWTYNTIEEWNEEFPFWSYDTVKRTLKKLRDKKILVTARYNKKDYDRTLWYRIDYEKLNEIENTFYTNSAKCTNEENSNLDNKKSCEGAKNNNSAKCPNGKVQNAPMEKCKMPQPIPETIQEITTTSSSKKENDINIFNFFEDNICKLRKTTSIKFANVAKNVAGDFLKAIIEECTMSNVKSYKGFEVALQSYLDRNCKTAEDVREAATKFREDKKKKKTTNYVKNKKSLNFNNYEQREYDYKTLEDQLRAASMGIEI